MTALVEIRRAVRELCAGFPGEYWRSLEPDRYPEEFVRALTDAGYLAALIPEEYGGSGLGIADASIILEEINRSGGNAGACHAQMYTMGTLLRHGSAAQKARWLPAIASGELRLQAFGVTEPTSGSDTLNLRTTAVREGDHYIINGQKIWTSRRSANPFARFAPNFPANTGARSTASVPIRPNSSRRSRKLVFSPR